MLNPSNQFDVHFLLLSRDIPLIETGWLFKSNQEEFWTMFFNSVIWQIFLRLLIFSQQSWKYFVLLTFSFTYVQFVHAFNILTVSGFWIMFAGLLVFIPVNC